MRYLSISIIVLASYLYVQIIGTICLGAKILRCECNMSLRKY